MLIGQLYVERICESHYFLVWLLGYLLIFQCLKSNIEEQGRFWKKSGFNRNDNDTVKLFVSEVRLLELEISKKITFSRKD